ncbi:hypothetical protein IP81_06040 [Novosphingobium sp. AAP83]|uniref:glutathione S-transferase family protein n=1 Tax=Novosphingobium sp. AAP83 TaxID=1523425 RepID=UPI0006B94514|nr:glutathione S-transferase N-terminal domain-containing protein [Novosphingobium sp. AAP83]KPF92549.1 hypothetical protein IP81_06040 [Novosphingobium sp. AAP83]
MKLHWSPVSPYVRKVMIVALETGFAGRLERVRSVAVMSEVNASLSADNPLNKLPTLVCDDGRVLFDSCVICEFLDPEGILHPRGFDARICALRRQAFGDGLLDLLILLRNERNRPIPFQSPPHLSAWLTKAKNALDRLEAEVPGFDHQGMDIGDVSIGCALGYLDVRFADMAWREGRPMLDRWEADISRRSSFMQTVAVVE